MFKIVSNVGEWDTLFISGSASVKLRNFLPSKIPFEDRNEIYLVREGEFLIERLAISGKGNRPRMILMISERDTGLVIAARIKSEIPDIVSAIMSAHTAADISSERRELEEVCQQFDLVTNNNLSNRSNRNKEEFENLTNGVNRQSWARTLASCLIAAALTSGLFSYFAVKYFTDASPDENRTATLQMKREFEDLNLKYARLDKRLAEASNHHHSTNETTQSIEGLKERIAELVEQISRLQSQNDRKSDAIKLEAIEFEFGDSTFLNWRRSLIYSTKSVSLSASNGTKNFGKAIIGMWIEPLGNFQRSQLSELDAKVERSNQATLSFKLREGNDPPKGKIRVYILFKDFHESRKSR